MLEYPHDSKLYREVSVLFNEPKLLKSLQVLRDEQPVLISFSALQRAEIAEM